jgi:hypothetical protein
MGTSRLTTRTIASSRSRPPFFHRTRRGGFCGPEFGAREYERRAAAFLDSDDRVALPFLEAIGARSMQPPGAFNVRAMTADACHCLALFVFHTLAASTRLYDFED